MFDGTLIDHALIEEAARRLAVAAPQARIILIGSAARGELTDDSDLDFVVLEPDVQDRYAEQLRLRSELSSLRVPVDVLVYSNAEAREWGDIPGTVLYTGLTEGRVLL